MHIKRVDCFYNSINRRKESIAEQNEIRSILSQVIMGTAQSILNSANYGSMKIFKKFLSLEAREDATSLAKKTREDNED